ncbi:hypothetical protein ACGFYY_31760 [Streptomyces sp. NPDC048331]|uniref:hypothetical protein n=1 Tax=Streptomyces sp. NPDC048331 TaxID=3365534 RepID=UPI00371C7E94
MRTAHRFTTTAALACAAALGLTGCFASGPFADLSGSEVADKSVDTLRGAASLTVSGKIWDEGKPMELNMAVSKSGDCRGTIAGQEGSFELIRSGELVFIKADEPFYRSQMKDMPKDEADAAVTMLAGHWLKSKASDADSKELASLCDLDELLKDFDDSKGAEKGEVTSVDGRKALTLTTKTDEGTETLLVATEGKPYLLKASITGKEPAEVSFSGIDKPVNVEAPTGKDVIDADQLG